MKVLITKSVEEYIGYIFFGDVVIYACMGNDIANLLIKLKEKYELLQRGGIIYN